MKERRRHPRYPIHVVFDILDGEPALRGQGRGAIVDLSEGGAAFESEAFLEKGQHVHFEIPVPIGVWAKVLRVRKEGVRTQYAVEFGKVRLVERWLLRRLLAQAQKKGSRKI